MNTSGAFHAKDRRHHDIIPETTSFATATSLHYNLTAHYKVAPHCEVIPATITTSFPRTQEKITVHGETVLGKQLREREKSPEDKMDRARRSRVDTSL